MNDIVFLGKRIFSQCLDMMRSKVPFVFLWYVLGTDKIFIVTNRHHHRILASALTVIYGRFVL